MYKHEDIRTNCKYLFKHRDRKTFINCYILIKRILNTGYYEGVIFNLHNKEVERKYQVYLDELYPFVNKKNHLPKWW